MAALFDTKKREYDLDRLIIDNRTHMHMVAAMQYVVSAMLECRSYQYHTVEFTDGVVVTFSKNSKSDKFVVEFFEEQKDREHFTWDEMVDFNGMDWIAKGWERK